MSRHSGRLYPYQIEIQTFNHRHNGRLHDSATPIGVVPVGSIVVESLAMGPRRMKLADIASAGVIITRVKRFADYEAAKRWGSRFGTVIACEKIDTSRYLRDIEYKCKDCIGSPPPLEIQIGREEYALNENLELVRSREEKLSIDLLDTDQ